MPRSLPSRLLRSAVAAFAAAALSAPAPSLAAGYGDVKGKVVLDGEAPDLAPRVAEGAAVTKEGQPVKDAAVCAADAIPDFSLVVGEGNGIANVFLYPLRAPRDVKPELKEPPTEPIVFDQQGCVFKPHAIIVRTGQTLKLVSSDPVAHNVRFTGLRNRPGLNTTVPANSQEGIDVDFTRAEPIPIPALCDFHPWMKANWLIVDHPYAVITDARGEFVIEGLPEGQHSFTVWHESAGFLDRALSVTVEADGTTDLGELKYDLAAFKNLKD